MDLRSQLRLEIDEPVHVTVLGECETKLLGRVTNYSNYGLGLLIDREVSLGAAIRVEWSQTVLLGDVCYCRTEGEGFAIGLQLEHALCTTAELARLARRLVDESPQEELPQVRANRPR